MTEFLDFAIFGIMTGLFSAIGSSIAKIWIEPKLKQHKDSLNRRVDTLKKQMDELRRELK